MQLSDDDGSTGPASGGGNSESLLHCLLFDDTVTDSLCLLRKRELHERGEFSCGGCASDRAR